MVEREFIVPGEPRGKARPRVTKNGAFTPRKQVEYENLVKVMYLEKYEGAPMMEGPITAFIEARFAIPKSFNKKKREAALRGEIRPTKRPDADNIIKSVLDSLNGVAYHDDAAVTRVVMAKKYTDGAPCVHVVLHD